MKTREGFLIETLGNIISYQIEGSFDHIRARRFVSAIKDEILLLEGKPFKLLANHLKAHGATPESYELIEEYNAWLNTTKLQAKAIVSESDVINKIELHSTPSKNLQNIAYFSNIEEAMEWLQNY